MAAGSIVVSSFNEDGVRGYNIYWTCDSGGDVNGYSFGNVFGKFQCSKYTPDQASGYTPSSGYDIKLYDGNSADVLGGSGANQTDGTPGIAWNMPWFPNSYFIYMIGETLELNIQNAGQEKRGDVAIILE